MSDQEPLLFEKRGNIALVTFNRPETYNAQTGRMHELFHEAFVEVQEDDEIRCAILTGAGKAFSAGGDLDDFIPRLTTKGVEALVTDPAKRFLSDCFKPIIAAVRGPCIAGGLEILQGTDIRIAGHDATFGLGEVRWGFVPAGGSHVRLPRQIPWAVAMQILLTGRPIDAQRAYEIGLVNELVEPDKVLDRAFEFAEQICKNAPLSVPLAKEIAVRGMQLEPAFNLEMALASPIFHTEDAKEGPLSFVEKRKPEFKKK